MAYSTKSLDDYVDVAERIAAFYERFAKGSLQPARPDQPWELVNVSGIDRDGQTVTQTFIVYTALAYRAPDDVRPGVGVAWEIFPGRTPYTRGSELMNAETSAWGRAIAALGIATRKGIASRQEVDQARQRQDGLPVNRDGSLSRSRTSDEEKAAAGVMTSPQQAEHTALAKPDPLAGPVERGPDPEAAQWETAPEDRPGSLADSQLRSLHVAFTEIQVNDRADRLAKVAQIIGHEVRSSKELSYREAGRVLAELESEKAGM